MHSIGDTVFQFSNFLLRIIRKSIILSIIENFKGFIIFTNYMEFKKWMLFVTY